MSTSFLLPLLDSVTNLKKQRSTEHSLALLMIVAKFRYPNLPSILTHKVGKIHLALLSHDGSWGKTPKSLFLKLLEECYSQDNPMERKSYTKVLKGTEKFCDYSECLRKAKERSDSFDRRDMIFDVYSEDPIKPALGEWSGSQKRGAYTIQHREIPLLKN